MTPIKKQTEYYTLSHQLIDKQKADILLSPIMIVGSPRSGTTWLQKLLLENKNICGGQESYFYSLFNEAFLSVKDTSDARGVGLSSYWSCETFNQQMQELWIRTFLPLFDNKPQSMLLLDKTPFHALFLDDIAKFLPQAKFIHIIRDSRAVTASLIVASKGWGSYWASKKTKDSALEWYRHVKSARCSYTAKNSPNYLEVHYEDLLDNTYSEMTRIFNFIGLSVEQASVHASIENQLFSKQKQTGSSGFINAQGKEIKEPRGFFRKGLADAWKQDLNIIQKLIVWRFTRKLMEECGYDWNGRSNKQT